MLNFQQSFSVTWFLRNNSKFSKERDLFEIWMFNIINVFTATYDWFNVSLLNKIVSFFLIIFWFCIFALAPFKLCMEQLHHTLQFMCGSYIYVIYVQIASIFCLCYQFDQQSTMLILP